MTDRENHRIVVFDPHGQHIKTIGGAGNLPGEFTYPWGALVDKEGKILVADGHNYRLQILNPEGEFLEEISCCNLISNSTRKIDPMNPILDKDGNLLVVDCTGHQILFFG